MTLTVSTPVKIFALVAILGALGLGGGMMLLGHGSGSTAAPKTIKPLHPVHKGRVPTVPAAKPAVHHAAKPAAKAKAEAKAAPKRGQAAAKPLTPTTAVAPDGLPNDIALALQTHDVVVVSLYDPKAAQHKGSPDAAAVGEAEAGAKLAGAGFVPLNVLSQGQALPLAKKLGVLSDPALLVFRRGGDLVTRIDGFADRETVAQAAKNAHK